MEQINPNDQEENQLEVQENNDYNDENGEEEAGEEENLKLKKVDILRQ